MPCDCARFRKRDLRPYIAGGIERGQGYLRNVPGGMMCPMRSPSFAILIYPCSSLVRQHFPSATSASQFLRVPSAMCPSSMPAPPRAGGHQALRLCHTLSGASGALSLGESTLDKARRYGETEFAERENKGLHSTHNICAHWCKFVENSRRRGGDFVVLRHFVSSCLNQKRASHAC